MTRADREKFEDPTVGPHETSLLTVYEDRRLLVAMRGDHEFWANGRGPYQATSVELHFTCSPTETWTCKSVRINGWHRTDDTEGRRDLYPHEWDNAHRHAPAWVTTVVERYLPAS